jgi:hypothetical protein
MRKLFWFGFGVLLASVFALAANAQTAPAVTLTVNPTTGISPLSVTLTWTSTGATTCTASNGWSGVKALSGSETVANLTANRTFTLSCGTATGVAKLSWTAPTQNTDNSPISAVAPGALAGFEVFHATTSAAVPTATPILINDKAATTYTLTGLPVGPRYYRIKAFNTEGIRSDLSAEVSNTIVLPSATANASVTVNVKPKPPVLSSTITVVYEIAPHPIDGIRLAREVGTIPRGTECVNNPIDTDRGEYYEVALDKVTLSKMPKSAIVVTKCAWVG